jgi:hypothetical protein
MWGTQNQDLEIQQGWNGKGNEPNDAFEKADEEYEEKLINVEKAEEEVWNEEPIIEE